MDIRLVIVSKQRKINLGHLGWQLIFVVEVGVIHVVLAFVVDLRAVTHVPLELRWCAPAVCRRISLVRHVRAVAVIGSCLPEQFFDGKDFGRR